jgi:CRP-like cAMP-binding protein
MALDDDIRRLARIPLFAELDQDALRLIAFSAEARILRAGDVVYRAGDASDAGYFVMSGSIALEPTEGEHGKRTIGRDALLGEVALLVESKRSATATAREPTTVLKISRQLFHRVLQESPASAARLRNMMAARLIAFAHELESVRGFKPNPLA